MSDAETVTTSEAARLLGLTSPDSARSVLHRLGVRPVGRAPGRGGESLYDVAQIRAAVSSRPGQGARTDKRRE